MSVEYEDVQQFIAVLPDAQKVSQEVYNSRLAVCRACAHLSEGTCVKCGCYVEMRAIKKRMTCPDVTDRWEK